MSQASCSNIPSARAKQPDDLAVGSDGNGSSSMLDHHFPVADQYEHVHVKAYRGLRLQKL